MAHARIADRGTVVRRSVATLQFQGRWPRTHGGLIRIEASRSQDQEAGRLSQLRLAQHSRQRQLSPDQRAIDPLGSRPRATSAARAAARRRGTGAPPRSLSKAGTSLIGNQACVRIWPVCLQ